MEDGDRQDAGGGWQLRPESIVIAKTVTLRKARTSSAQPSPHRASIKATRLIEDLRRQSSLKRIDSGPTLSFSRPASAAAVTHSRIHQALRRNESEFMFSSKQTTVDGFLYSSRFQQDVSKRPMSSKPTEKKHRSKARGNHSAALRTRGSPLSTQGGRVAASPAPESKPGDTRDEVSIPREVLITPTSAIPESNQSAPEAPKPTPQRERVPLRREKSKLTAPPDATADSSNKGRVDESAFLLQKRRCARTFEDMIFARLQSDSASQSTDDAIQRLLDNGIMHSIMTLSIVPDPTTQAHCCRALYYLSQVPTARKTMIAQGLMQMTRSLLRAATTKSKLDLASTLCHLTEEKGLIDGMLHDGLDRCLIRLVTTPVHEVKRVCALAVFNISTEASRIKHFIEAFSQLLITSTKTCFGNTGASEYLLKAVYNVALAPIFHASLLGENVPRFLSAQLPSVAEPIKILSLKAIISLCDIKPNRSQILSQPFCKLLETLLNSTSREIQEMALLVLLLLSIDEGSRIRVVNWVSASTIIRVTALHVDLFRDTDDNRQAFAASVSSLVYLESCFLRNLCDSVLTHHELVEAGVVRLLLRMSRLRDNEIKTNAVCALCSIIASSTDESLDYVVEIIEELISLTRSPLEVTYTFAITAIYNIACSDDSLPLLTESKSLLTRVLEIGRAPPREDVAKLTAAIIYRLTTVEEMQQKMLELDSLGILIHLIRVYPASRPYAANALYLLSHDGGDMFPHGGDDVAHLVSAMSDTSNHSAKTAFADPAAAQYAVTLLAHLAQDRRNHSMLVKGGAVLRFLKGLRRHVSSTSRAPGSQVHEGGEIVLMNTGYILFALTETQEGSDQFVREEGIEELIYLARTTVLSMQNAYAIKELFMLAMCRISSFIGLEVRLVEHGAIDAVMVLALVTTDNPTIKALCIKTLANCLVAKNCVRPLIEHGVIWALSSLAGVDSPDTRYACAVSLCNLATVPFMLSRFLDAGAPRALLTLLEKSTSEPSTTLVVIKAIANLVANEKICMALMNEDIERHLSFHFANPSSSAEVRQLAAMVLLRVTSANDAIISLERLKTGVFVWMEQIIVMEDETLVRNCMLTVHDLTCNSTIDIAELNVDHILRIVIQVFSRHPKHTEIVTLCLWTLYNVSCHLAVVHAIVRPETMQFIRERVPLCVLPAVDDVPDPSRPISTNPSTLNAKTTTATNSSDTTQLQTTNPDIKLCTLILHNISCVRTSPTSVSSDRGTTDDVLAALVNMRGVRVLSDIYAQREDLREICAIAVSNISIGRVNSTKVVDDGAGALLAHFVFGPAFHRCHHILISTAIRRLINAPGNQPILLRQGLTKAIVRILADVGEHDMDTLRNLVASVCQLSRSKSNVPLLLEGGVLPAIITICDSKQAHHVSASTAGGSAMMEILSNAFEILSNACTVNFEAYVRDRPDLNVVSTLTRLSEIQLHTSASSKGAEVGNSVIGSHKGEYYERGEGHPLPFAQVLKFMMKTPSSSVKKNLELRSTFQVPARKWLSDIEKSPWEPPLLECNELPLTEGSQSIPDDVRQQIRRLAPLQKEKLVLLERVGKRESCVSSAVADVSLDAGLRTAPEDSPEPSLPPDDVKTIQATTLADVPTPELTSTRKLSRQRAPPAGAMKKLQRGLASHNLSAVSGGSLLLG
ncbi:hypothetical protein PINS_up005039 [Pythium insidiosum]|nr:hypothetical protein PINS_up005039 [Pythium insidiosum]